MSPALRPTYDGNSYIIAILILVIVVLLIISLIFLFLWLSNRNNQNNSKTQKNSFTLQEQELINSYKKLSEQNKELVNNTIKALNSKEVQQ